MTAESRKQYVESLDTSLYSRGELAGMMFGLVIGDALLWVIKSPLLIDRLVKKVVDLGRNKGA